MIRFARASALVALVAFAPASFAGNLIPNPDFSRWLYGWSPQTGSISTDLEHGSPAPPSAQVYGDENGPDSDILSPCVAIAASLRIDFSFETLVVAGTADASVVAYSDERCTVAVGSLDTGEIGASADWTTVSQSNLALPPGTRFVRFEFHARHSDASPFANAYVDHVAIGETGTLPAAIPIDQLGLTGAWYDPDESGQGFQFTIDPIEGALFGAWYTYDAAPGGTETQRWYSLQATLSADDSSADITIFGNTGGTFDGPPVTTSTPVGTGTLAFDSCTSGTFAYTMDDGREGSVRVRTVFPQMYCDEGGKPTIDPGAWWLSGAWYDPSTSGQGVMVSIDQFVSSVFVGWYTYAPGSASAAAGEQRWFSAQGNSGVPQGNLVPLDVYESTGGVFDANDPVSTRQVGTATLHFASCDTATLDYTFTSGDLEGRSGSIPLSRLGATPEACMLWE